MNHHWNQHANIRKWLYKEQPKNVLEVGALKGENTKNLISVMEDIGFKLMVISDDAEQKDDGVTRIKGVSYREIDKLENESVDFVILDTDHNYWTMGKELLALHPKLRPNGIIMLHDVDYYYVNSGESTAYADGSFYPKEEIVKARTEHGGMGHAVIDWLSVMKRHYKLELWIQEECGVAVLRKLPDLFMQLVLEPGYCIAEGRKVENA